METKIINNIYIYLVYMKKKKKKIKKTKKEILLFVLNVK